jgi:uncharacterized protein (TIGR02452 family)
MARHAVHMSAETKTAVAVGGRRGAPIVLTVRAADMHRAGHAFQRSSNGVWLTDHVPPQFLVLPPADRKQIARETVEACERGGYRDVSLREAIDAAVAGTVLHTAGTAAAIPHDRAGAIEVTPESTFEALHRLAGAPGLGCLNFASAKNPGGGFLGGAQAQEEALCRSSALYPCLVTRMHDHYEPNRAQRSALYLDLAIHSPRVPFFRDDAGGWLAAPVLADVITCAAPNFGALEHAGSPDLARVPAVLHARAELVLRVAVAHNIRTLVLGAWGAGVFRNDPALVADAFAAPLERDFRGAFDRVVFAVLDHRPGAPTRAAFEARFASAGARRRGP